jgi:sec-independent protein translocase protein TatB
MLSVPHMIVVFVIVLVVFGPQKLPELARGLGKLMAEFRKASTDFKSAFEEEMRDIERQAREVERRKAEVAASPGVQAQPATLGTPSGAETPPARTELVAGGAADATEAPTGEGATEASEAEAPVVVPVAEDIVARGTETEATAARDPQKGEGADTQEPYRASADH